MNTPLTRSMGARPEPAVIGTEALAPASLQSGSWDGAIHWPVGVAPNALSDEQARGIQEQVQALSIHSLSLTDIAGLGAESEMALHQSLGAFLDRIDKAQSPQIFRLVTALSEAVKAEQLDALADQIIHGQPGFLDRLVGMLSPKKLAAAKAAMFENLQLLVAGKSRKLSGVLAAMEKDIQVETQKALEEARSLERLKDNYRGQFHTFVAATVFLHTLLAKARHEMAAIEQASAQGTSTAALSLQEAQDKVQALESRALAVEGVLTKLPAEQLVIRQVQTATIQTVQEITTTTAGRFASIKMTLLTLHSAMGVQNLQRTAQQGADLEANLSQVRNRMVTQVVTTAAHAPGDNRLAQAQQIQQIGQTVRELVAIADKARADNQRKFDEARALLAKARSDLTALGAVIRPDRAITP